MVHQYKCRQTLSLKTATVLGAPKSHRRVQRSPHQLHISHRLSQPLRYGLNAPAHLPSGRHLDTTSYWKTMENPNSKPEIRQAAEDIVLLMVDIMDLAL
jgi:hypothetical protein